MGALYEQRYEMIRYMDGLEVGAEVDTPFLTTDDEAPQSAWDAFVAPIPFYQTEELVALAAPEYRLPPREIGHVAVVGKETPASQPETTQEQLAPVIPLPIQGLSPA